MSARILLTFVFCLYACGAFAEDIALPTMDYQGHPIEVTGKFEKPSGTGPFAVVIVLHDCAGMTYYYWSGSLPNWVAGMHTAGYATLVLDSFSARGVSSVCDSTASLVPERVADVFAAAYVLAGRPDVKHDKIALLGQSHGASVAMLAATEPVPGTAFPSAAWREKFATRGKLAAAVSLYGGCFGGKRRTLVPLLMLLGEKDDWAPPAGCVDFAANQPKDAEEVRVKVYPGAYHSFDTQRMQRVVSGHTLAYDRAATLDAEREVQGFFHRYLD
jgi:dienelactone hydrolase